MAVGDLVLARDDQTGETGYKPVVALIAGSEREIWEVTVETTDAAGTVRRETIGTTDEHPWRLASGERAETDDLRPGAELVVADGDRVVVLSALKTDRIEPTYNFEVGDFHTYFVGESGVWVHNACLTALGRGLAKKFGRPGSAFGQVRGSPETINAAAQQIYDNIVANGVRVSRHHARFGNVVEYRLAGLGGVRISNNGKFIGFLEP